MHPPRQLSYTSSSFRRLKVFSCLFSYLYHYHHPHVCVLSVSAATPGSSLPSRNSREAPPPVEICVILPASPKRSTAAAESPPPIMVVAVETARALATSFVPAANWGSSNTPIGPFQMTVRAFLISVIYSSIASVP